MTPRFDRNCPIRRRLLLIDLCLRLISTVLIVIREQRDYEGCN